MPMKPRPSFLQATPEVPGELQAVSWWDLVVLQPSGEVLAQVFQRVPSLEPLYQGSPPLLPLV